MRFSDPPNYGETDSSAGNRLHRSRATIKTLKYFFSFAIWNERTLVFDPNDQLRFFFPDRDDHLRIRTAILCSIVEDLEESHLKKLYISIYGVVPRTHLEINVMPIQFL